jgi:hypothetical protein
MVGEGERKLKEDRERQEAPRGALDDERDEHRRTQEPERPDQPGDADRSRDEMAEDRRGECRTRGRDQRRDPS